MIHGNPNAFLDRIYSCQDTVFVYCEIKYWYQGYMLDENCIQMEIFQYQPAEDKIVWQYTGLSLDEGLKNFVTAPIFEGKSFWEAESEIEWVDE